MPKLQLIVAEPQLILREGVCALLERVPHFTVTGRASDARTAIRLARRFSPDVLVTEAHLPQVSHSELLRQLARQAPGVKPLFFTTAMSDDQLLEAVELGARGLVLKDATPELLIRSIEGVAAGEYWLGRGRVADAFAQLRKRTRSAIVPAEKDSGLSPREIEMIKAAGAGFSNKEIAVRLAISENTVKHHLTKIFSKLKLRSRVELLLYALHNGLVVEGPKAHAARLGRQH